MALEKIGEIFADTGGGGGGDDGCAGVVGAIIAFIFVCSMLGGC